MRRLPCLVLVMLAVVAAPLAASEVYSWKDAQGVNHYSQTPPPVGTQFTLRNVRSGGASTLSPPATAAASPAATSVATAAAQATSQCDLARANIVALQDDAPVHQSGADGAAHALDATQRASQLELAQAAVRAYCG